jgi:hypothetical protein
MAGVLLLQVPPVVLLDNVMLYPLQTVDGPLIEATDGLTVTVAVAELVQPEAFVTVAV